MFKKLSSFLLSALLVFATSANASIWQNRIYKITTKNQVNQRKTDTSDWIEQKGTTYNWAYDYAGKPHAASHIGDRTFSYDANGNQSGWDSDVNGTRRDIVWDEENRIAKIADNGRASIYIYDADNTRVLKVGKQGEMVYVNPYFVVKGGGKVASKHFYIGSQRESKGSDSIDF